MSALSEMLCFTPVWCHELGAAIATIRPSALGCIWARPCQQTPCPAHARSRTHACLALFQELAMIDQSKKCSCVRLAVFPNKTAMFMCEAVRPRQSMSAPSPKLPRPPHQQYDDKKTNSKKDFTSFCQPTRLTKACISHMSNMYL